MCIRDRFIGKGLPSWGAVRANAHALARYAATCQDRGLTPIVEPEVLMDGDHDIDACEIATRHTLQTDVYKRQVIPYSGTFLCFADYSRAAIRIGALMLSLIHI